MFIAYMVGTPQQEFVEYIEKYPECFEIAQSPLFMRFLRHIVSSPRSFSELVSEARNVEENDLKLILLALETALLISRAQNIQKEVCFSKQKM